MEIEKKFLIEFFKRGIFNTDILTEVVSNFEFVSYNKNDFLLKENQLSKDFLFLQTGFVRAFSFDTEGNEVTTNFYKPNSIVFEIASYFKQTPTKENIQALTHCTGWVSDYNNFQKLFHSFPEFREFGRANLVNGFIALKERMLSIINLTAEQRYHNLITTNSEIFQIAPLKHIASFLGITDTSLSRIRKEFAQKNFLPNDKLI